MPTTHHSAAAERHMQAAHFHEAAAASHNKNDHLGAHEQSRLAHEHSIEAHRHSEQVLQQGKTTMEAETQPESASQPDPTVPAAAGDHAIPAAAPLK